MKSDSTLLTETTHSTAAVALCTARGCDSVPGDCEGKQRPNKTRYAYSTRKPSVQAIDTVDLSSNNDHDHLYNVHDDEKTWPVQTAAHTGAISWVDVEHELTCNHHHSYSLTVFSPSGKLVQIEHALAAVNQGTTSLGIKGKQISPPCL